MAVAIKQLPADIRERLEKLFEDMRSKCWLLTGVQRYPWTMCLKERHQNVESMHEDFGACFGLRHVFAMLCWWTEGSQIYCSNEGSADWNLTPWDYEHAGNIQYLIWDCAIFRNEKVAQIKRLECFKSTWIFKATVPQHQGRFSLQSMFLFFFHQFVPYISPLPGLTSRPSQSLSLNRWFHEVNEGSLGQ